MVRCMLLDSNQPKNMWGEAISLAVAINNRLPTSANSNVAPIVKWDATLKPSITHLHRFGAAPKFNTMGRSFNMNQLQQCQLIS
jgi:hypothetical protein